VTGYILENTILNRRHASNPSSEVVNFHRFGGYGKYKRKRGEGGQFTVVMRTVFDRVDA